MNANARCVNAFVQGLFRGKCQDRLLPPRARPSTPQADDRRIATTTAHFEGATRRSIEVVLPDMTDRAAAERDIRLLLNDLEEDGWSVRVERWAGGSSGAPAWGVEVLGPTSASFVILTGKVLDGARVVGAVTRLPAAHRWSSGSSD